MTDFKNTLYYGDNLDIMRRYIADESVDLIYLDPPFNSDQDYNILFKEQDGSRASSQIRAFKDTWTWNQESEAVFLELVTAGGRVSDIMQAFRVFLGPCDMLAYLVMMAPRLLEMRRILKSVGSIYLHCDPTASHYLKLLMDAVYGAGNFKNEIIWYYRRWSAATSRFQRIHDVVFFFTKGSSHKYNMLFEDYTKGTLKRWKGIKRKTTVLTDGSLFQEEDTEGVKGANMGDVWPISIINSQAKERLGYPTQKPEALLERIIKASSNEGDVVFDPFCGCGTAIAAAQKLKRYWIGIDITCLATTLIKQRLQDTFFEPVVYDVIGEPVSVPDAEALAASDPYQFQWWALGLVGARPTEGKKGADKGIDGKIIFQGKEPEKFETVIISVKAGNTGVSHVRDLKGVVDREKAAIGVLISMQDHTKPMKEEAVVAGFYESAEWGRKYPKVQLFTVADLLAGKKIEMPPIRQVGATFKKAPKAMASVSEQSSFDL